MSDADSLCSVFPDRDHFVSINVMMTLVQMPIYISILMNTRALGRVRPRWFAGGMEVRYALSSSFSNL